MQLSEKEIEDYIYNDIVENGGTNLIDKGFYLPSFESENKVIWERQLNIDPYGIIDIVGFYRFNGCIHVDLLELKACPIDCNHFDQILRYRKGIIEYLKGTFRGCNITFNCFLVGNGYSSGHYINNCSPVGVIEFTYSLDGIEFEKHSPHASWHKPTDNKLTFRKPKINGKKVY